MTDKTVPNTLSKWQKYRLKDLEAYKKRKREYVKSPEQRQIRAEYQKKWRKNNKDKYLEQAKKSYHKNKSKHFNKIKEYHLKRSYGITLEEKLRMVQEQNNLCKICNTEFKNTRLTHLDHCHITGKVRGILCSRCNGALGWFEKYKNEIHNYIEQ